MKNNISIKPGKGNSLVGMIMGILFFFIGIFMVIPNSGIFGIIWTIAVMITVIVCGINAFSDTGIATHEIVVDSRPEGTLGGHRSDASARDVQERLNMVQKLYDSGTITRAEYEEKRRKILDEI